MSFKELEEWAFNIENYKLVEEMFSDLLFYENLLLTLEFKNGVTEAWKGKTTLDDYDYEEIAMAEQYLQRLVDFSLD